MSFRALGGVALVGLLAALTLSGCDDATGGRPRSVSPPNASSIKPAVPAVAAEKATPPGRSSCALPPTPPPGMLALQICEIGEDVGLANPNGTPGGDDPISVNAGNNIDKSCGPATCRNLASGAADKTGVITLDVHGYKGIVTVWDGSADCYEAFNLAAKRALIFTCPIR